MNWQVLQIAADTTHHIMHNKPAYNQRFSEVLAFHPPGLAAVRLDETAWHIHPNGQAAYAARFKRTFGFYQGLAAVITETGWQHIDTNGTAINPQTYDWCGNFQGGLCSVRNAKGEYWHIEMNGQAAYPQRWRYAGDFRDGIAVVQSEQGYSTHITVQGEYLHQAWFLDLDVFHKGFARAKDEAGWMHINKQGQPIYCRRFAAVEPFYNGQARVELMNGALELIDETGTTLVQLRSPLHSEFAALSADMVGFWRTQTIAAAVTLGLFDHLPDTAENLANACGLANAYQQRLLAALAELSLVQAQNGQWHCTERGQYLQTTHPLTLAGAAQEYAGPFSHLWSHLPAALTQNGAWQKPTIFADVARDELRQARHHQMLLSYARHDYVEVPARLDLQGTERIIDAGGGLGALAQGLLQTYPELQVTLLDRPEVITQAKTQLPPNPRLDYLAKDLFSDWGCTADSVILARVLHDWDDEAALHILRQARSAVPVGGRVFVIEMLLSEDHKAGALCDLHLLMVTGGRERTLADYAHLLTQADFQYSTVHNLNRLPHIIVGVAQ